MARSKTAVVWSKILEDNRKDGHGLCVRCFARNANPLTIIFAVPSRSFSPAHQSHNALRDEKLVGLRSTTYMCFVALKKTKKRRRKKQKNLERSHV